MRGAVGLPGIRSLGVAVLLVAALAGGCEGQTADGRRALEEALSRALPDRPVAAAVVWPEGTLSVKGHFALEDGEGQRWRIEVDREARVRADGAMRLRETRRWRVIERPAGADVRDEDRWDHFEAVSDGRVWVTRRGDGPWIARDVTDGHHLETLRRLRDWLPELMAALGAGLARTATADPPLLLAGRTLTWQRLGVGSAPSAPVSPEALRALRDDEQRWPAWFGATHRVERATGRVAILSQAAPGRPEGVGEAVLGELDAAGSATVSGRRLTFTASASQSTAPLPADETFALPEGFWPADRPRVWPMIREVLGDRLAPWAGGQAQPADAASDEEAPPASE